MLSSCGGFGGKKSLEQAPPAVAAPAPGISDYPVRLGSSFQVGSVTYTPADIPGYDDVGFASPYGADMAGRQTANGESFTASAISGAHKTLPLPSYVEVTSLDTGRTILVRINDRGPMSNDRLIDLSEGAAKQLGIAVQGMAGVRVRKVNPPEQERAVLRSGQMAAARIGTPESLLKVLREKLGKTPKLTSVASVPPAVPTKAAPAPAPKAAPSPAPAPKAVSVKAPKPAPAKAKPPAPAAAAAGYVVQVAAFSSRARADELARKLDARVVASADGRLFRVRFGPFASEAEGQKALADAKKRGYPQARLYRE
jgi:rare lipoprotein A